jgi:hypothetical protein
MKAALSLVAASTVVLALALSATAGTDASWRLVKRSAPASAGELAYVGGIVRRPTALAVRAISTTPDTVTLQVVLSCRSRLKVRIARQQIGGRTTFTRPLRLPLAGADNCAVSATGTSTGGMLRLELLRAA